MKEILGFFKLIKEECSRLESSTVKKSSKGIKRIQSRNRHQGHPNDLIALRDYRPVEIVRHISKGFSIVPLSILFLKSSRQQNVLNLMLFFWAFWLDFLLGQGVIVNSFLFEVFDNQLCCRQLYFEFLGCFGVGKLLI